MMTLWNNTTHETASVILEQVNKVHDEVIQLSKVIERQNERRESNEAKISKIEHVVFGNGRDGLNIRVDRIEQRHTKHLWIIGILATILSPIISLLMKILHAL